MPIETLRQKLAVKRTRVKLRYDYYDMKNAVQYMSKLLPAEYGWLAHSLGWSAKAVDSLADRLAYDGVRNDTYGIQGIFEQNNKDVLFDSAVLGAMIGGCSFIYISRDENNAPRLQVIDGSNATGEIDPITYMLREGYAVLERDKNNVPTLEAYFLPHETQFISKGGISFTVPHKAPYPLLVPVIYRPDATRPFGHSRISRACMSLQQGALRTLKRSEICSEFYSFPQKYVLGLSDEAEFNGKAATLSTFLSFSTDENGNRPQLGQFQQQSMTPFTEQIRTFAALFAGETGLTLDDLGFVQDNPSSAEAIKASHETLRLTARKAQRTLAVGFLNAGFLAACLRDDFTYNRQILAESGIRWQPIFEPDANAISAIGDAVLKFNQAVPGYITEDTLREMLGW